MRAMMVGLSSCEIIGCERHSPGMDICRERKKKRISDLYTVWTKMWEMNTALLQKLLIFFFGVCVCVYQVD